MKARPFLFALLCAAALAACDNQPMAPNTYSTYGLQIRATTAWAAETWTVTADSAYVGLRRFSGAGDTTVTLPSGNVCAWVALEGAVTGQLTWRVITAAGATTWLTFPADGLSGTGCIA